MIFVYKITHTFSLKKSYFNKIYDAVKIIFNEASKLKILKHLKKNIVKTHFNEILIKKVNTMSILKLKN